MKNIFLLLISSLFWATSCEEIVDWEVKQGQERLVVEGSITNELKQHTVTLSRTVDYFNNTLDNKITEAEVRVLEGNNEYIYEEIGNSGTYQSIIAYAGEVGKTYRLEVRLKNEIGGFSEFEATTEMQRLVPFDNILLEYEEKTVWQDAGYIIKVNGVEPAETNDYYKIVIYRNGELLTRQVDELVYYNDDLFQGLIFDEFPLYSHEDIKEGDEILMEMMAIEKSYYQFLVNISSAKEGGDPFGMTGPPSNVFGNISNNALGYFYAADKAELQAMAGN